MSTTALTRQETDVSGWAFLTRMAAAVSYLTPNPTSEWKPPVAARITSYSAASPSIALSSDTGCAGAIEKPFTVSVLSTRHRSLVKARPAAESGSSATTSTLSDALIHLTCRAEFVLDTCGAVLAVASVQDVALREGKPLLWLDDDLTSTTPVTCHPEPGGENFLDAMASVASAVYVVTGRDAQMRARGLTATSVLAHSADHRSVVISIDRTAFSHDSLVEGKSICLNLLRDEQADTARLFASKRPDKFEHSGWSSIDGMPVLAGTAGFAICRIVGRIPFGDHTLVVATVRHAEVNEVPPLLYWRRGFGAPTP